MSHALPAKLVQYLPKGHRLWYAEKQGALRHDWLQCVCGLGVKLEKIDGATEPVTDEHWLAAVNQCRLSQHSKNTPCLPVTLDGEELPVRDAPEPEPIPVHVVNTPPTAEAKLRGRPKKVKEPAHA